MAHHTPAGIVRVLARPWVFTQSHPLGTSQVIDEAKRRGVVLDPPTLRELYRQGYLCPLVEVTTRAVCEPQEIGEPRRFAGTLKSSLDFAVATGRLRDLSQTAFRPKLRFDNRRINDPSGWWNGLIYSRWQLLAISDIGDRLGHATYFGSYEHRRVRLPALPDWQRHRFDEAARWAVVLVALEARYFPKVLPEWLHLMNVETEDWQNYRDAFDPAEAAASLGVAPDDVKGYAERLLTRARDLDPMGNWSRLLRRANRSAWKSLKGDALVALDMRLAAEILMLFYEDLVDHGVAPPLEPIASGWWHPQLERISARDDGDLDRILGGFGISPHPGVVLAVEGEVEEFYVRQIFRHLKYPISPDVLQVICMRGSDRNLALVAAATVAPILGERRDESYDLVRPPTRLVIAVDRGARWSTDAEVEAQRRKILDEIEKVVVAQGAAVKRASLDDFVHVRQWQSTCFEFSHFTDAELADGLTAIHETCGGLDRGELIAKIAQIRSKHLDVNQVWSQWNYKPSKLGLAAVLWPVLKVKIDAARDSDTVEVPRIAEIAHEAYILAKGVAIGNFVI